MIKTSLKSSIISFLIILLAGSISTAENMTGVANIQTLKINIKWNKNTKATEEDVQDINPVRKGLTPAQAIKIVREYPEVKNVINANPARPVHVEVMENKADQYILRTYTIVPPQDGLPGHTATFGWYSVEKKTEKITSVNP